MRSKNLRRRRFDFVETSLRSPQIGFIFSKILSIFKKWPAA